MEHRKIGTCSIRATWYVAKLEFQCRPGAHAVSHHVMLLPAHREKTDSGQSAYPLILYCSQDAPLLVRCEICPEEWSHILDITEVAWVPSRKSHSIPRPKATGVGKTPSFYNKLRVLPLFWVHQPPLLLTPALPRYSSLLFLSLITSADFWCLQANSSELILSTQSLVALNLHSASSHKLQSPASHRLVITLSLFWCARTRTVSSCVPFTLYDTCMDALESGQTRKWPKFSLQWAADTGILSEKH